MVGSGANGQDQSRVLLFDAAPQRAAALHSSLSQRGWSATRLPLDAPPTDPKEAFAGATAAVVLFDADQGPDKATQLRDTLNRLVSSGLATVVWGPREALGSGGGPLVEWLAPEVALDEVVGKIGTMRHYAPLLRGMERELNHLHRLGEQLNRHFGELDQELRLASRLQRDFLPRQMPVLPPYAFEVLYRPATWVSGDMYDVFRIDEHHIGMFIADAMGHGVAAGLLTMFLRQALVAKQVDGTEYTIVRPGDALRNLHECLVRQHLPNCQFVTAAYAIIDRRSGAVQLARAGHPYPLLVDATGAMREVRSEGSLLGLDDIPAVFEETTVILGPGCKLVFYTDGVEDVVLAPASDAGGDDQFRPEFAAWARQPGAQIVQAIDEHLNCVTGSLNPADDVTLLIGERE